MSLKAYWPYIFIAYFALLAFGLLDNIRGPFFPEITNDLKLRDDQASWFFAFTSVVAFLGSYYAPKVQSFIGSLMGLRLGLLFLFLGFFVMSFADSLGFLLLGSGMFGMGMGLSQVFEHVCIQEGATVSLRRRLVNGLHSFYALAALFAPLSAGLLIELSWTWKEAFLLVSILPALALLVSLFIKTQNTELSRTPVVKASGKEFKHMFFIAVILDFTPKITTGVVVMILYYIQLISK